MNLLLKPLLLSSAFLCVTHAATLYYNDFDDNNLATNTGSGAVGTGLFGQFNASESGSELSLNAGNTFNFGLSSAYTQPADNFTLASGDILSARFRYSGFNVTTDVSGIDMVASAGILQTGSSPDNSSAGNGHGVFQTGSKGAFFVEFNVNASAASPISGRIIALNENKSTSSNPTASNSYTAATFNLGAYDGSTALDLTLRLVGDTGYDVSFSGATVNLLTGALSGTWSDVFTDSGLDFTDNFADASEVYVSTGANNFNTGRGHTLLDELQVDQVAIPEPSSFALMGLSLLLGGCWYRLRHS